MKSASSTSFQSPGITPEVVSSILPTPLFLPPHFSLALLPPLIPKVLFEIRKGSLTNSAGTRVPEFPDLSLIRATFTCVEHVEVTLATRPEFFARDRRDWLTYSWPNIRERVLETLRQHKAPVYDLRKYDAGQLPPKLEYLRAALISIGGIYAGISEITVQFEKAKHTVVCVDVTRRTSRFDSIMRELEQKALKKFGVEFEIISHATDKATKIARAIDDILARPNIKRPRFLGQFDDPKRKFLRLPADLRGLKWWGMDSPLTKIPEDVHAVVRTKYGNFLVVAIPMTIFENRFRQDAGSVAFFAAGRIDEQGRIDRPRVGYGVISAPTLVVEGQLLGGELAPRLKAHKQALAQAIRAAPSLVSGFESHLAPGDNSELPEQLLTHLSIKFLQGILRQTLKLSSAPFIVRPHFNASGPVVLRGFEIGDDSTVPLKASDLGGSINQLQLYRALTGQAPLPARRLRYHLRKNQPKSE